MFLGLVAVAVVVVPGIWVLLREEDGCRVDENVSYILHSVGQCSIARLVRFGSRLSIRAHTASGLPYVMAALHSSVDVCIVCGGLRRWVPTEYTGGLMCGVVVVHMSDNALMNG